MSEFMQAARKYLIELGSKYGNSKYGEMSTDELDSVIHNSIPGIDRFVGHGVADNGMLYGEIGNDVYLITGESGNNLITVTGFARDVRRGWSQWHEQYIEKCARSVVSGEYESIFPASGSDIFYIRESGNAVIASTRPNGQDELKTFELIS